LILRAFLLGLDPDRFGQVGLLSVRFGEQSAKRKPPAVGWVLAGGSALCHLPSLDFGSSWNGAVGSYPSPIVKEGSLWEASLLALARFKKPL